VQALAFKWLEDGLLSMSIVSRRDKALQRSKDGRRTRGSKEKEMPWVLGGYDWAFDSLNGWLRLKRKALDVKSAGTQHRHPRGKSA
jgi:hypothetical protein